MRPALLATMAAALCVAASALSMAACGGDDGDGGPDLDAATDGPPGVDAPACALPPMPINCTAGDDSPCTAMCPQAYCHLFGQVGTVCTNACAAPADCPIGWSCNNMGRCRPPN